MWYVFIGILILIVDQVSKIVVAGLSGVTPGSLGTDKRLIATLIDGFLEIEYCENNNGMMGIFSFLKDGRLVFIVATVIILGGIIVYLCLSKNRGKWLNTALAFIISGALGNFIDRIFNNGGYVRDMIHVIIEINGKEYFPYIFNVADIALVVGAIMLIVDMLFIGKDAVFMSKKRRAAIEKDEAATNKKLDEARDLIREINNDKALPENAEAKSADRASDDYDDLIDDDYSDDESDEKNENDESDDKKETKSGDENK